MTRKVLKSSVSKWGRVKDLANWYLKRLVSCMRAHKDSKTVYPREKNVTGREENQRKKVHRMTNKVWERIGALESEREREKEKGRVWERERENDKEKKEERDREKEIEKEKKNMREKVRSATTACVCVFKLSHLVQLCWLMCRFSRIKTRTTNNYKQYSATGEITNTGCCVSHPSKIRRWAIALSVSLLPMKFVINKCRTELFIRPYK